MALRILKEKAIKLRKNGLSYSQIKKELGVSKGTLSGWLREYPLSSEQVKKFDGWRVQRNENFRLTFLKKREKRLIETYEKEKRKIGNLNSRELFLAGLFLYWGEGAKNQRGTVSLSNTDPSIVRFYIKWLIELGISPNNMTVTLHLYADMNPEKEILFWSHELDLPRSVFRKPYIKSSNLIDITYCNGFNHGTCMLRVFRTDLSEKVLMGIKYLREEIGGL